MIVLIVASLLGYVAYAIWQYNTIPFSALVCQDFARATEDSYVLTDCYYGKEFPGRIGEDNVVLTVIQQRPPE